MQISECIYQYLLFTNKIIIRYLEILDSHKMAYPLTSENPDAETKNDEVLPFMMKDTDNSSNHGDKQSNHGDKESNHSDKDSNHGDQRNIVTSSVNGDENANGNKGTPHRNKTVISGAGDHVSTSPPTPSHVCDVIADNHKE